MSADDFSKGNKDFYNHYSESWNDSRQIIWPGWKQFWTNFSDDILMKDSINILDVGCGNGRLIKFYNENIPHKTNYKYYGSDISENLIEIARTTKAEINDDPVKYNFSVVDITNNDQFENYLKGKPTFDIVSIVAVAHHIDSPEKLVEALRLISSKMNSDSLLLITFWDFLNIDSIKDKLEAIDNKKHLYKLDWGASKKSDSKLRYLKWYSDAEIDSIVKDSGLRVIKGYKADGRNAKLNQYFILKTI